MVVRPIPSSDLPDSPVLTFLSFQTLNARAGLREEMRTTRFNGVELPVRYSVLGTESLIR